MDERLWKPTSIWNKKRTIVSIRSTMTDNLQFTEEEIKMIIP